MNEHSERIGRLVSRFPRIFKGAEPQLGITIDAGWDDIFGRLCTRIDELLSDGDAARFRFTQVKEKLGGLRVYYAVGDSADVFLDLMSPDGLLTARTPPVAPGFPRAAVDAHIREAAAEAAKTCESCGQPGILRRGLGYMLHVTAARMQ